MRATWQHGRTHGIRTDVPAEKIEKVMLVRFTSTTHLVDGGQRGVELPIRARRDGGLLLVGSPESADVLPPGPYMLFVVRKGAEGPVPSVAKTITVK